MQLKVTGKNIDVGDSLRAHVSTRLDAVLDKLFTGGGAAAHVTFEREGASGFRCECSIHLDSGIHLQSRGTSNDPYLSFEQAAERLEKRLRRYKRWLKDRRVQARAEQARDVTFAMGDIEAEAETEEPAAGTGADELNALVVAETTTPLSTWSVAEAVMQLDLSDAPFILFRNAAHGGLNVVYRRSDGNIGWIDPARDAAAVQA